MASREANLKHRYGITLVDYNEMLSDQNCRCKICDIQTSGLVVDHCHDSGDIRGLLCSNCNKGLGLFKDNPERMVRAANYILETKTTNIERLSTETNYDMDELRGVHGSGLNESGNTEPSVNSPKSKRGIGTNLSFVGPFLEDLQALHAVSTASGNRNCN